MIKLEDFMNNYELASDEVILYENSIIEVESKDNAKLILTSKRIILEKNIIIKKGFFKTESTTVNSETYMLENIKTFNGKSQVQQKNSDVYIQTIEKNFTIRFIDTKEAKKFVSNITDAITGKTAFARGTDKVKETLNTVDDVLGLNTRDVVKGVITNGLAGGITKGVSGVMKKTGISKRVTNTFLSVTNKKKK
jgi:hypothetical protein